MTCAVDYAMGDAMGDALWACLVVTYTIVLCYVHLFIDMW